MDKVRLAIIAAIVAALVTGGSVVATRYVVGQTDPLSLAFYRYLIAVPCVAVFFFTHAPKDPVGRRDWTLILLLGAVQFGLFPWAYSASLAHTTAPRGALVMATIPIMALILARALGRESLNRAKVASVVLAFVGVAFALGDAAVSPGARPFQGEALMFLASLFSAAYAVLSRPLIARQGALFVAAGSMAAGLICLLPLAVLNGTFAVWPDFTVNGWLSVLYLGVIGGALQFGLWVWSLRWIDASLSSICLTLTPLVAMLLGAALLAEPVTPGLMFGLVLVASGILLAGSRRARAAPPLKGTGSTPGPPGSAA